MKKILLFLTLFLSGCYTTLYQDDVYYRDTNTSIIVQRNYYNPYYDFYRYRYSMFWDDFMIWGHPFGYGYNWQYGGFWGNYWTPYYRYSDFFWTRPHWTPIITTPPVQRPNKPVVSTPRSGSTRNYYPSDINTNRQNGNRATTPTRQYERNTPAQISQPRYQRTPTPTQPRYTPQSRPNTIPQTEIRTRNSGAGRGGNP